MVDLTIVALELWLKERGVTNIRITLTSGKYTVRLDGVGFSFASEGHTSLVVALSSAIAKLETLHAPLRTEY